MMCDQLLGMDPTTLMGQDLQEIRIWRGQCDAHGVLIQRFQAFDPGTGFTGQGGCILGIRAHHLILEEPEQLVLVAV
jgi:hypothetical protein